MKNSGESGEEWKKKRQGKGEKQDRDSRKWTMD